MEIQIYPTKKHGGLSKSDVTSAKMKYFELILIVNLTIANSVS